MYDIAYPNAVACALQGIDAVNPRSLVKQALDTFPDTRNVFVLSIGKAATTMAQGAVDVLADRIVRGIVVAPTPAHGLPPSFIAFQGGHPIPNAEGAHGARAILELVQSLGENDTVLCLISGGASALSTLPPRGIALDDLQSLTTLLLRAGATIDELNCVRKHVDQLKGGRLARAAAPAQVTTLILSDVIGDPVDVIASGPTVPDPTTFAEAVAVLRNRGVWGKLSDSLRAHFTQAIDESPKPGDSVFVDTSVRIIGNNSKAAAAACECAELLGYRSSLITTTLHGEARDCGAEIAKAAIAIRRAALGEDFLSDASSDLPMSLNPGNELPLCLVYAGETTVTVHGSGRGGRNQEFVLAAAMALQSEPGITVVSIGTDGIDGPTDAAGAFADSTVLERARAATCSPDAALHNNDAYTFWKTIGGLIVTGPTGTNVMDLVVVTIE